MYTVLVVVVVAAHSSRCSPGPHLHRQIDRQAPMNKTNVIASPPCQLQVAQTSTVINQKGRKQISNKRPKQKVNPKRAYQPLSQHSTNCARR